MKPTYSLPPSKDKRTPEVCASGDMEMRVFTPACLERLAMITFESEKRAAFRALKFEQEDDDQSPYPMRRYERRIGDARKAYETAMTLLGMI
jgi:hypothetical protein